MEPAERPPLFTATKWIACKNYVIEVVCEGDGDGAHGSGIRVLPHRGLIRVTAMREARYLASAVHHAVKLEAAAVALRGLDFAPEPLHAPLTIRGSEYLVELSPGPLLAHADDVQRPYLIDHARRKIHIDNRLSGIDLAWAAARAVQDAWAQLAGRAAG